MRRISVGAAAVGSALLVAGVAACSSSSSTSSATTTGGTGAAGAPVTVRLGFLANITHAPALVALKNGYFTKALGSAGTRTDLDVHQRHAGDHRHPGRPARRGLRRPEPGDQRLAEVRRHRHQDRLRRRDRRRVDRGEVEHQRRQPAEGPVAGHAVARQHPGRRAALLAQAAGARLQRHRRRRRLHQAHHARTRPPSSSSSQGRSPARPSPRRTTSRWSRTAARSCCPSPASPRC